MKQWKSLAILSAGALLTIGLAAYGSESAQSNPEVFNIDLQKMMKILVIKCGC